MNASRRRGRRHLLRLLHHLHGAKALTPRCSKDEDYYSSPKQMHGKGKGRKAYNVKRRSKCYRKFKEGAKSITSLTYSGTFGALDKVLAFIQQFDADFGDENFSESSKLRNVSMRFTKATRQWWSGLHAQEHAPRTWKALRLAIMKSFLHGNAKDKVLTAWQSLKMMPHKNIDKYIEKFWDSYLKAMVYQSISFAEHKQKICAGLPDKMNEYVHLQWPNSINVVIHHALVASQIKFNDDTKRSQGKAMGEQKGKSVQTPNASKT